MSRPTNFRLSNLLEDDVSKPNRPPLAGPEVDDLHPSAESGIDDGFLAPKRPNVNDFEFEGVPTNAQPTPDVNVYQQKKTLAQGMLDLSLLSANANQLRYVLEAKAAVPYYVVCLVLISTSIALQIGVGVMLIWNSTFNVKRHVDMCRANRINNFTVISIFMITITNVFISVFAVQAQDPSSG